MSTRIVTAALDPFSNLVKRGLLAYSKKSNHVVRFAEPVSQNFGDAV